jgi:hypothetical protein
MRSRAPRLFEPPRLSFTFPRAPEKRAAAVFSSFARQARGDRSVAKIITNTTIPANTISSAGRTKRTMTKFGAAFVALAALLCCGVSKGHAAAGNEAWCIVTDEGDTHCNYANAQECLAVAAGSHGFCNENSTGGSAPAPSPAREKRRARQ